MLTWSLFFAVGAGLAATDGLLLAPPVVAEADGLLLAPPVVAEADGLLLALPVVAEADMHWWLNYLEQMERAVGRSPDMAHLRALLATTNSRYGAWVCMGSWYGIR